MLDKLLLQYKGFINTPNLWEQADFYKYPQIEIDYLETPNLLEIDTTKHHRLGKLVECFFQKNIEQNTLYSPICNNIQIQTEKKITLGELDFICNTPDGQKHIELTYKFYLYKTDIKGELNRWVGPNLRDSLVKKLDKLRDKQFPMLANKYTQPILDQHNLSINSIEQVMHFKANLFVPLSLAKHTFQHINNACVKGYYISHKEIDFLFPFALYQIPNKQDWLIDPADNTDWMIFIDVKPLILEQIKVQHSPLIWIKRDGVFERFFITFW
ncbi:DUF1853 family protein [Flavobacteriaceae bacterium]|nr:DUF1853 family protein [Flavobacteriaceae bacterium]